MTKIYPNVSTILFCGLLKKTTGFKLRATLALAAALLPTALFAQAPTFTYTSPDTYVANTAITPLLPVSTGVAAPGYNSSPVVLAYGFDQPTGIAVDATGNVYMCDYDSGDVMKYPAGGGAGVVLASGFGGPSGLAVDAAGNVYVADNIFNAVYEIPAGTNSANSIGSGFLAPFGVAVDAAGNVYVADGSNNAVKKIPAGGGEPVTIGTGFSTPEGVAVDAAGNVYVADYGNNAIKEILIGGGPIVTLGSGFNFPLAVSVDAVGNVYVADSGNSLIKEIPVAGGAPTSIASGFATPTGVAIGANGNVYVADMDNQDIEEVSPAGGFYISPALPPGLTFNQVTGAISGTPLVSSPATNYTITAYNIKGNKQAIVNIKINLPPLPIVSYSAQTFVAGQAITQVKPTSSNVAASNYSLTSTIVGSGFTNPTGVAVDAAGNVYVADNPGIAFSNAGHAIKMVPFGVGSPVIVASSYPSNSSSALGLGMDLYGNVYADGVYNPETANANLAEKFTAAIASQVKGPALGASSGLSVDGAGNIYTPAGQGVTEYYTDNSGNNTVGKGLSQVNAVAADPAGNLYVTTYPKGVAMIPAGGGATINIGTNVNSPVSIALDAAGNTYVTDSFDNALYKVPANGATAVTLGTGLISPTGVAIDNEGDAFVIGTGYTSVKKFKPVGGYYIFPALPAGLSFDSNTGIISGTPLAASPLTKYTVSAYNCAGKTLATINITINLPVIALPTVSYTSPHTYTTNTVIAPLQPTSSGVAAAKYRNSAATIGALNNQGLIAVDGAGNTYTTTAGGNIIKTPQGGSPVVIATGFTGVSGTGAGTIYALAADAAGDVYFVSNFTFNTPEVNELPANGGAYKLITSGAGITGIAVDGAGNVYVSRSGSTAGLLMYPPGGATAVQVGTGLTQPLGVAVDGAGNVYVNNNNSSIVMIPPNNGPQVNISTGFTGAFAITADAAGNVYVSDNNGNAIHKISGAGASNTIIAPGLSGGIAADAAGDVYVANSVNNYVQKVPAAGGSPVLLGFGFTIKPTKAVTDAAGNLFILAGTSLQEIPASGGGLVTISTGFVNPQGLALDAAGNIYIADAGFINTSTNGNVYKIAAGSTSRVIIGSGFKFPSKVAVDAVGNIYVHDSGKLYKIPLYRSVPINFGPTFQTVAGIAANAAGDVYVSDAGANTLTKIPANGNAPVILGSGFTPGDVSLDASGNVYVIDAGNHVVKEFPAAGTAPVILNQGLEFPNSVSVANTGVLYITDGAYIRTMTPAGGFYTNVFLPAGLTIDQNTGAISGTPLAAVPSANYTITAYNAAGNRAAVTNITVNGPSLPTVKYISPQIFVAGTTIAALAPASTLVAAPAYNTAVNTIQGSLISPAGLATDAAGNLYIASASQAGITKYPVNGAATTIGSNYGVASGVAVDAAGNIYMTNQSSKAVIKFTASGTFISEVTSGISFPRAVAADAAGNVYITDGGDNTVKKIAVNTFSATVVASGFNNPFGIAVDGPGNIYVAEYGNNAVKMIPAGSSTPVAIGSGFNGPEGVALDNMGNIYVADFGNHSVKMIPAAGGSPVTMATGFTTVIGVSTDGAGNIYALDIGTGQVKEITPAGGYFITPALPAGLSFNTTTGVISGTPTIAGAAVNYIVTAYNAVGGTAATLNMQVRTIAPATISYKGPQIYKFGNSITPLAPTGTGVAASAYSSTRVSIATGVNSSFGIAVDAAGNVYFADNANNLVEEIPVGGVPFTYSTGFLHPTGVAVDAAGNVFVADNGNNAVKEIPAGGGTPITIGSGFNKPYGVAVDARDNVYVTDQGNNVVKEILATSGTIVTLGSGFSLLQNIAVDGLGNVYVTDINTSNPANNALKVIQAGNLAPIVVYSGINPLQGVAVDAALNVFVSGQNMVYMVPPTRAALIPIGPCTYNIAVGSDGSLYVTGAGVQKISPVGGYYLGSALPAGLNFDGTTGIITGIPTVASPATNYTVTAYNAGGGTPATVNIGVSAPDAIATLSNLKINSGTITPVFAAATTSYTASVPTATSAILVTPTVTDVVASVTINGTAVTSGTASPVFLSIGPNIINIVVTAQDGVTKKTYTLTVTRVGSTNALLTSLKLTPAATLTVVTGPSFVNYATSIPNTTSSVSVTATEQDATATLTVNGVAVASGAASGPIALAVGSNTINIISTAQDGVTTKTYTITATRAASAIATLSKLVLTGATFTPAFATATTAYTASVPNATASVTVTPTAVDATATIKVNGVIVTSGSASASLPLVAGANTITTVVTAQDGTTIKTYTIVITRAPSTDALLTAIKLTPASTLTVTTGPGYINYTTAVPYATSSVTVTATLQDATATIKVNGLVTASGTASAPIALAVGSNTITTIVTAQDGSTTKSYIITATRATGPVNGPLVKNATDGIGSNNGDVTVHEGLSPNGDGINDYLAIDGITNYPDNRLTIIDRNGLLIYETTGYDNNSRKFDGHSNRNGAMQLSGTYFYSLDYTANGITMHKTGYIILKY